MTGILETIRSRGHWMIAIRPATFRAEREGNPVALGEFVQKNKVRMGGWHFPQIDPNSHPRIGPDFAEQALSRGYHIEHWRLYQSGQFVANRACFEDWHEYWPRLTGERVPEQGKELHVYPTVIFLVSVCEFAARLAMSPWGDEQMVITVSLRGMNGRRLLIRNLLRGELEPENQPDIGEYTATRELRREQLVGSPVETGLSFTHELFVRFHWDVQPRILRDIYDEMARHM